MLPQSIDVSVAGGFGNDILYGEAGNDVLRGDRNERSAGGSLGGDDILYGGAGNDRLGGKGSDTFVLAVGKGTDTINGFAIAQDKIGLAEQLTFGQLSFSHKGKSTLISVGDEVLARVINVTASFTSEQFVSIA